jgi:hypothetical protein
MPSKTQHAPAVTSEQTMTGLDQLHTKDPASCMANTNRMDATASRRLPRKSILEMAAMAPYRWRRSSGQRAYIPSTARTPKGMLWNCQRLTCSGGGGVPT